MSLDISVNSTNYLPQFYSNIFSQSFDSFKISYILLLSVIILGFVLIFALFGNSVASENSSGKSNSFMFVIEIILWIILILVVGINLTGKDYSFSFKNLFNSLNAELDVNVTGNDDDNVECKPKRDPSGCLIHEDKTKDDMLLEWADWAQEKDPELKKQFEKYLIGKEIELVDPELSKEFEKFVKEKEKEKEQEEQVNNCKESQRWTIFRIILVSLFFGSIVSFFSKFMFGIIVFFIVIFIFYTSGYFDTCGIDSKGEEEVFHIPNNTYCYEKARSICSKYNARLATYSEVEDAYNNGANWCSYGWSEDQLALFPTQLEIYNKLKLVPGHENDCGRPGINGGFIDNVNIKFGVNCFGKKPQETEQDKEYMERLKLSYSPAIDQEELEKITKEKNNMLIAPFNKDKWSYV